MSFQYQNPSSLITAHLGQYFNLKSTDAARQINGKAGQSAAAYVSDEELRSSEGAPSGVLASVGFHVTKRLQELKPPTRIALSQRWIRIYLFREGFSCFRYGLVKHEIKKEDYW